MSRLILAAVVFLAGAILGAGAYAPEPEVIVKTKEVVKTLPPEIVVEVETIAPEACEKLAGQSQGVLEAAAAIERSSDQMLDIMSRLRVAVASGDSNTVNALETEVRKLSSSTVGHVKTLGVIEVPMIESAEACKNGVE